MATTCYGQEHELPELDTFAPAGDDHAGAPAGDDHAGAPAGDDHAGAAAGDDHAGDPGQVLVDREPQRAPAVSGATTPSDEPSLAIDRMTVSIEDGLVMVLGPDGDPVPPQAVVRAAAERPEAAVALADGTTVVAQRLAMVLQAQTLGRLGAAEDGGWIMTMLQGRNWPDMASEKDLKTEQGPGVLEGRADRLKIQTRSGSFLIADAGAEPTGEVAGLFTSDGTPISVVRLVGLLREWRNESSKAIDAPENALDGAGDAGACEPVELDLSDGSIRTDGDGVWLDSPALAAVGGRLHLARWATRAPNGPVVSVSRAGGGTATLPELCAALGMARDAVVDRGPPSEIDDADARNGGSEGSSRLDSACDAGTADEASGQKPDDAPGWTAPDIALTGPASSRPDPVPVILTGESVLDLSFLDAADLEPLTLDGLVTDLPEDALPSTGVDGGSGRLAAHDPSARSSPGPLDSAAGFAGVTAPPAEDEASQAAVLGHATDEAPSAATGLPLSAASGRGDEIDPESIVLVTVRGVPDGARLSAGIRDDDGSWSLSPLDLPSVTIVPAGAGTELAGSALDGELVITGIALTEDGALAALSETVPLADYLSEPAAGETMVGPGAGAASNPAEDCSADPRPGAIALEIDPRIWDGEEFDALVIRDLPAGAGLSAGAYDPTIDGWVLMPQDLKGLTISPPADQAADFTLTLMAVVLRPGDTSAARVLTRLPVARAAPAPGSPTGHDGPQSNIRPDEIADGVRRPDQAAPTP